MPPTTCHLLLVPFHLSLTLLQLQTANCALHLHLDWSRHHFIQPSTLPASAACPPYYFVDDHSSSSGLFRLLCRSLSSFSASVVVVPEFELRLPGSPLPLNTLLRPYHPGHKLATLRSPILPQPTEYRPRVSSLLLPSDKSVHEIKTPRPTSQYDTEPRPRRRIPIWRGNFRCTN